MTFRISPRALLLASLALAAALALLLLEGPAQGSPAAAAVAKTRTFVSTKGLDTNTCGPADPCRTISRALVETSAGGEVVVLDSGGYGPFTIDKSVTVTAVGVYAGITATTGTAITVAAGATDKVVLHGLTVNGVGGTQGILASSFGQLYLQELNVRNFSSHGIIISLSASASAFISDTTVNGNGGMGLFLSTLSGTLKATVSGSRFERNNYGVFVGAATRVAVRDSLAADNTLYGFQAYSGLGGLGTMNVERSVSANNGIGLHACGGGTLRASETFVTGNTTGVAACAGDGSQTISFVNNRVHGNTTDGNFSSTVAQK